MDAASGCCEEAHRTLQDVRADPEKGFMALEEKLEDRGVKLEPAGPNEHVPMAESKQRRIKERVRGFLNILPYKLPLKLLIFLVYFVVSRINMTCDSGYDSYNVPPSELYGGWKIDYDKNLKAEFGNYVQADRNVADNTMAPRTRPAVALVPKGNRQGS